MKVLGVSASNRAWGNCETSVRTALLSAGKAGAEVGFRRLADLHILPCKGCFTCLGDGKRCPLDDDLYKFLEDLAGADALVLATPVYFVSPPGALAGIKDRLLAMASYLDRRLWDRPAVVITIMGNREWRGVAEPLANMTASLLGFRIVGRFSLVAEGPGDVVMDDEVMRDLEQAGRQLTLPGRLDDAAETDRCPCCGSDFFRIEPPVVVCPVCGCKGDLNTYIKDGTFLSAGNEPRWGMRWLETHVGDWIKPSVASYRSRFRTVLARLRNLKQTYTQVGEGGKHDVH